jgi:Flp pilus assembly pilin Flp
MSNLVKFRQQLVANKKTKMVLLKVGLPRGQEWIIGMEMIQQLYRDTSGATMVEYSLVVALIAVVAMGGVKALGESIIPKFQEAIVVLNGG